MTRLWFEFRNRCTSECRKGETENATLQVIFVRSLTQPTVSAEKILRTYRATVIRYLDTKARTQCHNSAVVTP
jgi:hypothetical protein